MTITNTIIYYTGMCERGCVCVCEREREREREMLSKKITFASKLMNFNWPCDMLKALVCCQIIIKIVGYSFDGLVTSDDVMG